LEPPYLHYQEADPVKKDRTTTLPRALHLDDNVHQAGQTVVRTSNFHYAHMRCAESTARSITVRQAFGAAFGAVSADEFAELRTIQDSYYRLAAAHRNAGRRIERRERRAENWAYFRQNPARMVRSIARDWARSVRSILRAVNV
jgi:hypothetical protein